MDFINLWPHDVNDLIFQHLSGDEVLDSTLVSPEWNYFLNRSSILKKITLVLPNNSEDGFLYYLMRSSRKYRHLRVEDGSVIANEVVEIIANPYHKFNTIYISRTEFILRKQIEQIILNCCLSLEKLTLVCITFQEEAEDELSTSYDFPKLQQLYIEYLPRTKPSINKYFSSFDSLETLFLINGCDEKFKELIRKSRNLKQLEMAGYFYDNNFFKDLSLTMPSRIEEFIFNNILSSSKDDENLRYFNDFFKSQSRTLKRFETDALIEPDEIMNAFKMPNMVELNVKGFHYNAERMKIELLNLKSQTSVVTPSSLVNFFCHYMDDILFELLAIYATNLKELKVRRFDPIDISNPAWFPKLEKMSIQYFNIELKDRIIRKEEGDRTNFEKRVLEAVLDSTNDMQALLWLEVDPF